MCAHSASITLVYIFTKLLLHLSSMQISLTFPGTSKTHNRQHLQKGNRRNPNRRLHLKAVVCSCACQAQLKAEKNTMRVRRRDEEHANERGRE